MSCKLGTLTSWNPLGHCRPATGLLYLVYTQYTCFSIFIGSMNVSNNLATIANRKVVLLYVRQAYRGDEI
jgi:hypothetical protein